MRKICTKFFPDTFEAIAIKQEEEIMHRLRRKS